MAIGTDEQDTEVGGNAAASASSGTQGQRSDPRSDIEQAVEARSDAVARGEGGPEAEPMTAPGDYSGNAGTGGEVKNQDVDAQ